MMLHKLKNKILLTWLLAIGVLFSAKATDYYVSASQGDDTSDGLTITTPWKTLTKLYNTAFTAGDKILFKSGDTWYGMFWLKGSGTAGSPIIVDKYGGTTKPLIDGDGYQAALLIYNDDYIEINNLELVNDASYLEGISPKILAGFGGIENDWGTGRNVRFGLKIVANTRSLTYFRLANLTIHTIYPTPTNPDNNHQGYGIKFESQSDQVLGHYYNTSNVIIEDCDITETGHYGIWTSADGLNGLDTYKHDDFIFRNNTFFHTGGSGIVTAKTQNILIENSVFDNTGSSLDTRMWERGSGLWVFDVKNAIVQNNQFLNAHGPMDSYGAHIDFNNENVVFQYNYSYNNEGGFVEILGNNINCGYRYNISVNDGYRLDATGDFKKKGKIFWVSDYCGSGNGGCTNVGTFIYNNTAYVPNTLNPEIFVHENTGDTHIYNNIVYVQSGGDVLLTKLENTNNTFDVTHNQFYQASSFNFDSDLITNAIYTDPLFQSPGSNDPEMYKLLEGSPSLGTGYLINGSSNPIDYLNHNGGHDFFGNPVSDFEVPNIGAYNGSGITVGVNDYELNTIIFYPNPTKGKIYMKTQNNIDDLSIQIFNMHGEFLKMTNNKELNLETYANGVYLLKINYRGSVENIKIIKQDE